MSRMKKHRVRRFNTYNWVVERLVPEHVGGVANNRGKLVPDAWVIYGYYNTIKGVSDGLVRAVIEDGLSDTEITAASDVAEALKGLVLACEKAIEGLSCNTVDGGGV